MVLVPGIQHPLVRLVPSARHHVARGCRAPARPRRLPAGALWSLNLELERGSGRRGQAARGQGRKRQHRRDKQGQAGTGMAGVGDRQEMGRCGEQAGMGDRQAQRGQAGTGRHGGQARGQAGTEGTGRHGARQAGEHTWVLEEVFGATEPRRDGDHGSGCSAIGDPGGRTLSPASMGRCQQCPHPGPSAVAVPPGGVTPHLGVLQDHGSSGVTTAPSDPPVPAPRGVEARGG